MFLIFSGRCGNKNQPFPVVPAKGSISSRFIVTRRGDTIFPVVIYPGFLGRSRRISPVNVTRAIPHPTARSQAPGPRVHPGNRVGKEKITHSKNMHTRVMMRRIRIQGLLSDCMGFDGY